MKRIAAFQLANPYVSRQRGYHVIPSSYSSPSYLWIGPVTDGANRYPREKRLEGYTSARGPAELRLGLSDGDYRVRLTAYERKSDHGPFDVAANGVTALSEAAVTAGQVRRWTFRCKARRHQVRLVFTPAPGKDFLVNTLEIFADGPVRWIPLFKTAPAAEPPSRCELHRRGEQNPAKALRRACDWLVVRRRPDGFLGDHWGSGVAHWYTVSMPIRALLAGYDILGDRRYRDAARAALDRFVSEQLPNGGWLGVFRGKPVSRWSKADLADQLKHGRIPMSDIGSVVSALTIASHYMTPAIRRRYRDAVRRFCDNWAIRFQQRSGGFSDGQWHPYEGIIYSCATAIQASVFSLASAATGEPAYRKVAERAIRFLLSDWRSDGRMLGRAPHWPWHDGKPFVLDTLLFGDQWYYDEGFITTWHHTSAGAFRDRIRLALHRRAHGAAGLLAALRGHAWWPIQDIWNNAKSVGIVQTLLFAGQVGDTSARMDTALEDMRRMLCAPRYAARLGVMPDDSERPSARHYLQTWSGMAMEATGFAGMTLAEMLKPGVLYLAS